MMLNEFSPSAYILAGKCYGGKISAGRGLAVREMNGLKRLSPVFPR